MTYWQPFRNLPTRYGWHPPAHGSADIKIIRLDHYEGSWWDGGCGFGPYDACEHPTHGGIYTPRDDKSGDILFYEEHAHHDADPWHPCNNLYDLLVWQVELPYEALFTAGKVHTDLEIIDFESTEAGCSGIGGGGGPGGGVGIGMFVSPRPVPDDETSVTDSGTALWLNGTSSYIYPPLDDAISLYGSMHYAWGVPSWFYLGDNGPIMGPSRVDIYGREAWTAVGDLRRWHTLDFTSNWRSANVNFILHSLKWVW